MQEHQIFSIFEKIKKNAMKQFLSFLLACLFLPVFGQAQTEVSLPESKLTEPSTIQQPLSDSLSPDSTRFSLPSPVPQAGIYRPFGMYGLSPLDYGYASWELHQGFNASIGLNVTFSPSKYAPSGVGFGQDAAFMYAVPLTKRFSVAGGVYASNMNWGFINYRQVGIAAVAAFQVNDRVSLYAYGNKSLMPDRSFPYYPLPNFAPDRLGGMVNFKLGESSSISIGVEGRRYPNGAAAWW